MEEKVIKDFDRHIENMMNEHVAAPPFGAWNRIAAELEVVPAPVVFTPAPAQPWISTGAVLGFISGALMIATLTGSWLLYNKYNTTGISTQQTTVTANQAPIVSKPAHLTVSEVYKPTASLQNEVNESKSVLAVKTVEEAEFSTVKLNTIQEVAAPTVKLPVDKQKAGDEPYYFPPVDINVPTVSNNHVAMSDMGEESKAVAEPVKEAEAKKIVSNSSSSRIKFKKKRSSGWNYGKINRTKSRSKY